MDYSKIEALQDIDNELILDILDEPLKKAFSVISISSIPKTLEAICMLQTNINFLKTGIFEIALSDNNYSMYILERALYEHFIKHFYLFIQYCKSKNDSAGLEYYKWIDIKEYRDYFNSLKKKAELKGLPQTIFDIDRSIDEIYSGYAEITNKDKNTIITKYSFYKMLKYIVAEIKYDSSVLTELPSGYSILSSFVHGGPHANRLQMFNSIDEEFRIKELYKGCKKAYLYNVMALTNTFVIAGQFNKELLKYVNVVKGYLARVPEE